MSKMSQHAAAIDESMSIADVQAVQAEIKDAYEFLEKLEATTWCKGTQAKIQGYLRSVGYWPPAVDADSPAQL